MCGNPIKVYPSTKGIKKYCSLTCRNKGRTISEETREKFRILHKTRKRKRHTESTKIKMSLAKTKEIIFTGFKSPKSRIIRNSPEYAQWRLEVFTRDNFTCVLCSDVGGRLEAHHILPFSKYEELRLKISNGITLCVDCHCKVDKYRNG